MLNLASEYGKQLLINFNHLSQKYLLFHQKSSSFSSPRNFFHSLKPQFRSVDKSNNNHQKLKIYSKKLDFWRDSAQVFQEIYGQDKNSFWLDSSMVEKGLSRFSYLGNCQGDSSFLVTYKLENQAIILHKNNHQEYYQGDIFEFLQQQLDQYTYEGDNLPFDFYGGFVGYLGYELKYLCGSSNKHPSQLPDAQFIFVTKMLVFDHQEENIYLLYIASPNQESQFINWCTNIEAQIKNLNLSPKNIVQQTNNKPINYQLSRNKKKIFAEY